MSTTSAAAAAASLSAHVPLRSRVALVNAAHLGSSFCIFFMAYSVAQNFQTSSDHKEAGATALGILGQ